MARNFVAASSQYLRFTGTPSVTAFPFSVSLLFKPSSAVAGTLISVTDATGGFWSLDTEADGSVTVSIDSAGTGTTSLPNSGATTLTNGTWYRLTAVYTSATSRTLYVNNTAFNDTTNETYPPTLDDISVGSLGVTLLGARSRYADGDIADAAIWSVALTAAQVATLVAGYAADSVRPASITNYWPIIGKTSPEIDVYSKQVLTVTGATVADHPRLIYIKRRPAVFDNHELITYVDYLNAQYDILAFTPSNDFFDASYDILSFSESNDYLDAYYDLNAYSVENDFINASYDLNTFSKLNFQYRPFAPRARLSFCVNSLVVALVV